MIDYKLDQFGVQMEQAQALLQETVIPSSLVVGSSASYLFNI
jgi:hypothetical protein